MSDKRGKSKPRTERKDSESECFEGEEQKKVETATISESGVPVSSSATTSTGTRIQAMEDSRFNSEEMSKFAEMIAIAVDRAVGKALKQKGIQVQDRKSATQEEWSEEGETSSDEQEDEQDRLKRMQGFQHFISRLPTLGMDNWVEWLTQVSQLMEQLRIRDEYVFIEAVVNCFSVY